MNDSAMQVLSEIGMLLGRDEYPFVFNAGVVRPGELRPEFLSPETEQRNDETKPSSHRAGRSATRSWQWTERWERATRGPWAGKAREASPVICEPLRDTYLTQKEEVCAAYPSSKIWEEDDGIWMVVQSKLLDGIEVAATIVVKVPFSPLFPPAAWGFWEGKHWIGPRHTNYPNGSICAFEPGDATWLAGGSLVELLDLYTLWCVRHLYLKEFGVWPGRQVVHTGFERWKECSPVEQCGCGSKYKYRDCCLPSDSGSFLIASGVSYLSREGQIPRRPPEKVFSILAQAMTTQDV